MEGLGHRVVMVVRNQLFRHMLDQSAAFFARRAVGQLLSRINNDVGLVQRAVSETIGDLARESLVLVGSVALLFYYDAKLALLCMTAAPLVVYPLVRFGKRVRTVTRWSQEAQEHMSHVAAEAFAGHRIVKAFGAEGREAAKFERVSWHAVPHQPEGHARAGAAAAADGVSRRHRDRRRAVVRQPRDRQRPPDGGRVHVVPRGAAVHVRADQEAVARQRQPAAGGGGVGAHLRSARRPHRGASSGPARCRCRRSTQRDRIQGRHASATRTATAAARCAACRSPCAPGRWWRSSAAAAPARPRSSTCCRGSTTSPAARS